jgi:hypothetical protein
VWHYPFEYSVLVPVDWLRISASQTDPAFFGGRD